MRSVRRSSTGARGERRREGIEGAVGGGVGAGGARAGGRRGVAAGGRGRGGAAGTARRGRGGGGPGSARAERGPAARKGRINHPIVHWCFEKYWPIEDFIRTAKGLVCTSIELLPVKYFPQLKDSGLTNAIGQIDMSPDPPFVKGFNNPKYWD